LGISFDIPGGTMVNVPVKDEKCFPHLTVTTTEIKDVEVFHNFL
jgi:hypothetical protein